MKARALLRAALGRPQDRPAVDSRSLPDPAALPCTDARRAPTHRPAAFALAAFLALTVLVGATASSAVAAGDANQPSCPAATEASPGFRTYLPDCRAYELASPPYTAGGQIETSENQPAAISTDGNHVIVSASGAFAGAENFWWQGNRNPNDDAYELTRTATGWETQVLTPPASSFETGVLMSATPDFSDTLWGLGRSIGVRYNEDIYLRAATGSFTEVGPGIAPQLRGTNVDLAAEELEFAGASSDLGVAVFRQLITSEQTSREQYAGQTNAWPGDVTEPRSFSLFRYSGTSSSEPELIGVTNYGSVAAAAAAGHKEHLNEAAHLISQCGTALGSGELHYGDELPTAAYNAVSGNGDTIYFTAAQCPGGPPANELYARLAGEETVPISEPTPQACAQCDISQPDAATFQGASQDGSRAFFLSEQKLFDGQDGEEGQNLYEYSFAAQAAHQSVALLGHDVSGVSRIAEDGSRVYFVSTASLAGADPVVGRSPETAAPVEGAQNLYLYDTQSRHITFVATLLTPEEEATIEAAEVAERSRVEEQIFAEEAARILELEQRFQRGEISEAREQELIVLVNEETSARFGREIGSEVGLQGPTGSLTRDRRVWRRRDKRPVQTTPDGNYLLFVSSAHLTGEETGLTPQIYRFDVAGDRLSRLARGGGVGVSPPPSFQQAPVLDEPSFERSQPTTGQFLSALTSEGVAFFTSAAPLVPQAHPGSNDVYESRGENLYLVSGGSDGSHYSNVSPSVSLIGTDPQGSDALFTTVAPLVPEDSEPQLSLYDARINGGFPSRPNPESCVGEQCQGIPAPPPLTSGPTSDVTQPAEGSHRRPARHKRHRKRRHHRSGAERSHRKHGSSK